MPRKSRRNESFQQFLASMAPADPPEQWMSVVETGVIDEHAGTRWQLKRGPLDVRVARRLATSASLMVIGDGASTRFRDVPVDQRTETWTRAEARYEGPGGIIKGPDWPIEPVYNAYEFESDDGRSMLLLDETC
ncbi:hypothetical protein ACIBJF_43240 [Streptomyces sp. NPDC050743]|uniref:hypothetical protein n=1 Tax=Streptomyces sp. NPDC050743 TaxID=3365634 RepID=UPI0037BDB804